MVDVKQIKAIWAEYGFPGQEKLLRILKKEGIYPTTKQLKEVLEGTIVKQLHKREPRKTFRPITTTSAHVILQIDLLDMSKLLGKLIKKKYTYILFQPKKVKF